MRGRVSDTLALPAARVRLVRSADLTPVELRALRALLDRAFGATGAAFADSDWQHALGGVHAIVEADGSILAHASVVPRTIEIAERPLRTGYVEAVATAPGSERRGLASAAIRALQELIGSRYELGALSTGLPDFYARHGWEIWRGPTFVRAPGGVVRTAEEDGTIMILRTPATPALDRRAPIACDWREGDVW